MQVTWSFLDLALLENLVTSVSGCERGRCLHVANQARMPMMGVLPQENTFPHTRFYNSWPVSGQFRGMQVRDFRLRRTAISLCYSARPQDTDHRLRMLMQIAFRELSGKCVCRRLLLLLLLPSASAFPLHLTATQFESIFGAKTQASGPTMTELLC